MGQRSATETLFGIVTAFVESRTWKQADLARRLEITVPAVRKRLEELQSSGVPLEREEDSPHVYWSVPKGWFPGALVFKPDEIEELLRALARSPAGAARTRLLKIVMERLPLSKGGSAALAFTADSSAVRTAQVDPIEEPLLSIVEDAARKKVPLRFRYYTASRGDESWRHASVHHVDVGSRSRFVATCHRDGKLKWFRVGNVLHGVLDANEAFRAADAAALVAFERESVGGYHEEGPLVHCAFFVRKPEATWVARNLLEGMEHASLPGGIRVSIDTTSPSTVARFVVSLGDAATPETPELAREIVAIANGALRRASAMAGSGGD